MLQTQYRMNEVIMKWSSDELYGGKLIVCASTTPNLYDYGEFLQARQLLMKKNSVFVFPKNFIPHGGFLIFQLKLHNPKYFNFEGKS